MIGRGIGIPFRHGTGGGTSIPLPNIDGLHGDGGEDVV